MLDDSDLAPIDRLVIGKFARMWLKNRKLMPSFWDLPLDEQQRILAADIRISLLSSPAGVITFPPDRLGGTQLVNLVLFDISAYDSAKLDRREAIALLLHEIGHVVNLPQACDQPSCAATMDDYIASLNPGAKTPKGEMEADDYARHCGYGNEIVTSLGKLAKIDPIHFNTASVKERIERVKDNAAPILNLS